MTDIQGSMYFFLLKYFVEISCYCPKTNNCASRFNMQKITEMQINAKFCILNFPNSLHCTYNVFGICDYQRYRKINISLANNY